MKLALPAALAAAFVVTPVAASAQSLPDTLNFIRDRMVAQGAVRYTAQLHDSANNSSWNNTFGAEATNVSVDAANCAIHFHWRTTMEGKEVQNFDSGFLFHDMVAASVVNREQEIRSQVIAAGHPTWSATVSPSVWVVTFKAGNGNAYVLDLTDENIANRILRAADHAMDLCGAHKESF